MFNLFRRNRRADPRDDESMARLEQAERDLKGLQARAAAALHTLETRHSRNHWRESVEQMIQGGS